MCSASPPPTARRASTARSRSSRRQSMSQPDLMTELREARPTAPREVRDRVRVIAERAPQPPRRLSWRLGLVVALGAALAIVAAVVATRGGERGAAPTPAPTPVRRAAPATPVGVPMPEAGTSKGYGAEDDSAAFAPLGTQTTRTA